MPHPSHRLAPLELARIPALPTPHSLGVPFTEGRTTPPGPKAPAWGQADHPLTGQAPSGTRWEPTPIWARLVEDREGRYPGIPCQPAALRPPVEAGPDVDEAGLAGTG